MSSQNQKCQISRRNFIKSSAIAGAVAGGSLGAFYFGYSASHLKPIRVAVLGTGDEGNVLIGAINPDFLEVVAIADIRPYNIHRAFHGDYNSPAAKEVRPGLIEKYGWNTESEARKHVEVYDGKEKGDYKELIKNAKKHHLDGVIIALPLHLHAPAAIAAMKAGLHVMTEKLMGHSVQECKEMARVAKTQNVHLATGHQRHYNILYHEAMDKIQRGLLGDLHYIRAQWHRGNMPGHDSWQPDLPGSEKLEKTLKSWKAKLTNVDKKKGKVLFGRDIDTWAKKVAQKEIQLKEQVDAAKYGYLSHKIKDADGKTITTDPIEELVRWRLWDRTGGGLMAELGSHQLDAASLFISAMHGGEKQHPLRVWAAGNRPLFPPNRDIDDHVACMFEFPAPGYDPKSEIDSRRKIGVQYASINGNGFGGYGEIVYGTKGTLILEKEQDMSLMLSKTKAKVAAGASAGPTMDTQASGAAQVAIDTGPARKVSRGYREELEHWAWCIQNPAPENQPRCHPKVALADAVIAHVTNISAKKGEAIEFNEKWFDIDSDETPEGKKPNLKRYA